MELPQGPTDEHSTARCAPAEIEARGSRAAASTAKADPQGAGRQVDRRWPKPLAPTARASCCRRCRPGSGAGHPDRPSRLRSNPRPNPSPSPRPPRSNHRGGQARSHIAPAAAEPVTPRPVTPTPAVAAVAAAPARIPQSDAPVVPVVAAATAGPTGRTRRHHPKLEPKLKTGRPRIRPRLTPDPGCVPARRVVPAAVPPRAAAAAARRARRTCQPPQAPQTATEPTAVAQRTGGRAELPGHRDVRHRRGDRPADPHLTARCVRVAVTYRSRSAGRTHVLWGLTHS